MIRLYYDENHSEDKAVICHDREGYYIIFKEQKDIFNFIRNLYELVQKKEGD